LLNDCDHGKGKIGSALSRAQTVVGNPARPLAPRQ
jgi:hypothetical protein